MFNFHYTTVMLDCQFLKLICYISEVGCISIFMWLFTVWQTCIIVYMFWDLWKIWIVKGVIFKIFYQGNMGFLYFQSELSDVSMSIWYEKVMLYWHYMGQCIKSSIITHFLIWNLNQGPSCIFMFSQLTVHWYVPIHNSSFVHSSGFLTCILST